MVVTAPVLDDSRAARGILVNTLQSLGFECLGASNGLEALAIVKRERPEAEADCISLVLADWQMPERQGLEFVRTLRSEPRLDRVSILKVAPATNIEQMVEALTAGANEPIMKPFTANIVETGLRMLQVVVH